MNKSSYTTPELRSMGDTLLRYGDTALGKALLELADYRDRQQILMARSRFDRQTIAYAEPDILDSMVKNELAKLLADKMMQDKIVNFSQSFDSETNEIIFHGDVFVLKGE